MRLNHDKQFLNILSAIIRSKKELSNMRNIDLLLTNGRIYSMEEDCPVYSWLAIKDGLIIDAGNGEPPEIINAAESIDLGGKCVLPGMYDNHVNLVLAGINSFSINLSHAESLAEVLDIISDKARNIFPGDLIRCVGYLESNLKERRYPTRQELDSCAPNNPVIVISVAHHCSAVNSLMLHRLALPYNLAGMEKGAGDVYSGYLTYQANVYARNKLFSQMDDRLRTEAVGRVVKMAIAAGLTNLVTFEGGYISHENHARYIIDHRSTFPIDIKLFYQSSDLEKARRYNLEHVGGMFLDGTFTGRSAAISANYLDAEGRGRLYFTQDDINSLVLQAHRAGFQLTGHCDGDRAVEQIIAAYEYAQSKYPREGLRHRIEHCELFNDDLIKRAKELNLILSMQPAYEHHWGGRDGMYQRSMGLLGMRTNPLRELLEAGLTIAGGSDYDITDINPWLGIHMAVNHPNRQSRITVAEAIKMYTIDGAYAVFEENVKGSLAPGKKGDLIILDKDPYETPSDSLKEVRVLTTIKEGNILYHHDEIVEM
ncbi:amidohydrolase [Deltaproteobacteria bacterium Smac51]|nr:amidohydrolase [Deltaproteobacteria bacterium Smac51]